MEFGISTFVNDDTIDTVTLARAIEERGLHSLTIAEHTHIPASRQSAVPRWAVNCRPSTTAPWTRS